MTKETKILMLTLFCFLLSNSVAATEVDPCGYGCPKSGCPQCPEGGPIKSKAERDKATADHQIPEDNKAKAASFDWDKCISSCDMYYDACEKRGNTNEYCSDQLKQCYAGCTAHK